MTASQSNVSNCDYCHGCVDFRFDFCFKVIENEDGNFLKCGTCTGERRASRRVMASKLKVGMRIAFTGSTWTISRIDADGKLYGVGGRGIFGNTLKSDYWLFTVRECSTLTVDEVLTR